MEADWEVEVGGDARVIEPDWAGFVDLRRMPEAAGQLPEASALPGLARILQQMNAAGSPVRTTKCDVWDIDELDPLELDVADADERVGVACYVDLRMHEEENWATHEDAAMWCGRLCSHLRGIALRSCRVDLVVRAAEYGDGRAGIAVTAYASAAGVDGPHARRRLVEALAVLADTLRQMSASDKSAKKLQ